jgi:type VI secretion system VasD/TssJ family lipoprotein
MRARTLLLLLPLVFATGCSRGRVTTVPAELPARPVPFTIRGTSDMNRGNAVVVRLYALRSPASLERATLPELWADDTAALGGDLVEQTEIRLFPGESASVELDAAGASHVAIVANLREPARDGWRHVFEASELRGRGASVTIGADRVSASGR